MPLQFDILTYFYGLFVFIFPFREQIDLRKESIIQFVAPSPYPVITFGPFASPSDVLISLSHAIGNFPNYFCRRYFILL